jgi:spore coat protein U-like protein
MKKALIKASSVIILLVVLSYMDRAFALCNVSTTPVTFGSYDVFSSSPLDNRSTITVNCDESPPPTVAITIRQSTNSGSFDPRAMKLATGSEQILYNLYTDSTRTTIWGDSSGSTAIMSRKVRKNKSEVFTAYGRIFPLQDVSVGNYNETLTVTINW